MRTALLDYSIDVIGTFVIQKITINLDITEDTRKTFWFLETCQNFP